tara:strand:+ start:627 stop:743 length:117 start_codon:yes stop_codon:yes gene_type:complete
MENKVVAPHIGSVISPVPENGIRAYRKSGNRGTAAQML